MAIASPIIGVVRHLLITNDEESKFIVKRRTEICLVFEFGTVTLNLLRKLESFLPNITLVR